MSKAVKVSDLNGSNALPKGETESLKGKVVVIKPEESEVAKSLDIKEKGIYSLRTR